jgi:hypothetical protein
VLWFTKNDEVFTYGIGRRGELVLLTLGCRRKTVAAGDSDLSSLKLSDNVGSLQWSSGFEDTVYGSIGSWGSSSFSWSGAEGYQAAGRRRRIRGKCTMDFGAQGGCQGGVFIGVELYVRRKDSSIQILLNLISLTENLSLI